MSNVDLGGSGGGNKGPAKERMIYMNLATTIVIMSLLKDNSEMGNNIVDALKNNITSSFTNKDIRKASCAAYGVKTSRKMKKERRKEFDIISSIFGEKIWGL